MATDEATLYAGDSLDGRRWIVAAGGGVVGALLFGALTTFALPEAALVTSISAVYGSAGPGPVAAWGLHLFHGAVLGLVFAAAVQDRRLGSHTYQYWNSLGLGAAFGAVITVGVVGLAAALTLSDVIGEGFAFVMTPSGFAAVTIGHLVFGITLSLIHTAHVRG